MCCPVLRASLCLSRCLTWVVVFSNYDLEKALEISQARCVRCDPSSPLLTVMLLSSHTAHRNLYPEMVYIYQRMGNTNTALSLIIEKLHDVKQAIAFVEDHKDEQLWEELISRSLTSPEFLSDLLEHVGSHFVDLVKLIRRIPDELPIPKLKHKLVKILSDCALQTSVRTGCNVILKRDLLSLQAKLHRRQRRAIKVAWSSSALVVHCIATHALGQIGAGIRCEHCEGQVFVGKLDSIVIFFCKHVYHQSCLGESCDPRVLSCANLLVACLL